MLFYRIVRWIVAGGSAFVYRAQIIGRDHLPVRGGYVLAVSHRSMMDIPFAAWLTPRRLRYMGKASLFDVPVLGWRQNGPKIQPLQPGAAYLALRAGVPILPVGIAGSQEILRDHASPIPHFAPVAIVVGEPITTPRREKGVVPRAEVDALTAQLHDTLQQLIDEAYTLRDGTAP